MWPKLPADRARGRRPKMGRGCQRTAKHTLTCINHGVYGSDFAGGELRLSLLRSPGYAGHPIFDRPVMAQDRFSPRIDQGERCFAFWINGEHARTRQEQMNWEALGHNERPYALSFFPSGAGEPPPPAVTLRDSVIQMTAFKQVDQSQDYVIRCVRANGSTRSTVLEVVPLRYTAGNTLIRLRDQDVQSQCHPAESSSEVDLLI